MATKIYSSGGQFTIDQDGVIRGINFEDLTYGVISTTDTIEFRDNSIDIIYTDIISEVQNGAGTPIGTIDDINTYISSLNTSESEPLGAIQFTDTQYTDLSRLSITADTLTALPNNKGGVLILQQVEGIENWIDNTGLITPPNGNGDGYDLRVTFVADPSVNNRNLTISIDIGFADPIASETKRLARGSNVDTDVLFTLPIYTLGTFLANGGRINIECDGAVEVYDIVFFISRTYKGTAV